MQQRIMDIHTLSEFHLLKKIIIGYDFQRMMTTKLTFRNLGIE
jgi:hypothetical protein